jgi:hypothetical protein
MHAFHLHLEPLALNRSGPRSLWSAVALGCSRSDWSLGSDPFVSSAPLLCSATPALRSLWGPATDSFRPSSLGSAHSAQPTWASPLGSTYAAPPTRLGHLCRSAQPLCLGRSRSTRTPRIGTLGLEPSGLNLPPQTPRLGPPG